MKLAVGHRLGLFFALGALACSGTDSDAGSAAGGAELTGGTGSATGGGATGAASGGATPPSGGVGTTGGAAPVTGGVSTTGGGPPGGGVLTTGGTSPLLGGAGGAAGATTGGATAAGGGPMTGGSAGSFPTDAASTSFEAQRRTDRTVVYGVSDTGIPKAIPLWGLDTAWVSETNIRRGVAFMGAEQVDIVRVSFTPTAALVNGELQTAQADLLAQRLDYVDLVGPHAAVVLNADPPTIDPWFTDASGAVIPSRLADLIDLTARHCEARGRTVLAAAPLNEPDYDTKQGTIQTFYDVAGDLRQRPRFASIRLTGGNTLSADQASVWYDALQDRLDEGNTHQLNGSFDSYAAFFQSVVANGDRAVNDELHNVVEAIIGVEYGVETGIWWGTAERARGEFVKTSDGVRLGYAEHRPNWTAAAVYRGPDGKVQAFGGASERQAVTTTYRFVSTDRAVFYDGHGPQREYVLEIPGGTGYWEDQPNAERVVNITWGDDVQPPIDGTYVLVNRNSGMVLEVADGALEDGANIQQGDPAGAAHQRWEVAPLDPRTGQDFSYFRLAAAHSGKVPDVLDFSLDDGAAVIQWPDVGNLNQHWYLEYAGDGWFYVCNRHSAKCLGVADDSLAPGADVYQWENLGRPSQQWRLLPVEAPLEFEPPSPPTGLVAFSNPASVGLVWNPAPEADVATYTVLRGIAPGGPYDTVARDVSTTAFVDSTAATGGPYYYVVRAVDGSLNRSEYSGEAVGAPTLEPSLVLHLGLDGDCQDGTVNKNHGAPYGAVSYGPGPVGNDSIVLDGSGSFVQLPPDFANLHELTVAAWVFWNGGDAWQRIFDFGNGETEYLFLTPATDTGVLRFAINGGAGEEILDSPELPTGEWVHVALLLDATGARLYLDGTLAAQSSEVTTRPADFGPVSNYIGRSQFPDPLFAGQLDDFRVYSYTLADDDLVQLAAGSG